MSNSGDDSAGRNFFFAIELEGGELRKFQKGRPGIKKSVDSIAGDEFALKRQRSSSNQELISIKNYLKPSFVPKATNSEAVVMAA